MSIHFPIRYLYFILVVGLVWSNDPESYASGSIASSRASHARQVKSDNGSQKGVLWSSRLVLGHETNNLMLVKITSLLRSLIMVIRWQQKAVNKKEWVPVINEAKVLRGL